MKHNIQKDIINAMLKKETDKRDALRFLMSKIQQEEKKSRKDITDEKIIDIIKTLIKQNNDSLSQMKNARKDVLNKLELENTYWSKYLPKQLSEEEIKNIIRKIINEKSISSNKQMGLVMKELKVNFPGQIDMKLASKTVSSLLN